MVPLAGGSLYLASDEKRRHATSKALAASARIGRLVTTVGLCAADYSITKLDSKWNVEQNTKIEKEIALKKGQLGELTKEQEQDTITMLSTSDPAIRSDMDRRIKQARQKIDITTTNIAKLNIQKPEGKFERCHRRCAERLRDMCAKNQGIYIKLGQHLCMLDYVLPAEYAQVLSSLLAQTPTSSWEDVQAVLQEDLGRAAAALFDSLDPTPIASASVAQVHIGYKDGKKLAVKVQHRGIREESVYDALAITKAVDVLGSAFEDFQYQWLTREMNINLPQELDFCHEKQNLERATENLRDLIAKGDVVIPAAHAELSSSRVLTMDFAEGVYISEVEKMTQMGVKPAEVAHLVSTVFCEQMYRHGFVHCDPHPANVLVRPHPHRAGHACIVLLDHGLYKNLDNWFRLEYCRLWSALVLGDKKEIRRTCESMGVGPAYTLLAGILTMRPWDDIINEDRDRLTSTNITAHSDMLKLYAEKYYSDIVKLLGRVDSDVLLLLKTNDCLRHLDKRLGSPVNTMKIVAQITGDVLIVEELFPSDTSRRQERQQVPKNLGTEDYKYQEEFKRKNESYSEIYMVEAQREQEQLAEGAAKADAPGGNGNARPAGGIGFWLHQRTQRALWNYSQMQMRLWGLSVVEWCLWATGQ